MDVMKSREGAVEIFIHTFEDVEQDVLDALLKMQLEPVYLIGPLSLLLERKSRKMKTVPRTSVCNPWKKMPSVFDGWT